MNLYRKEEIHETFTPSINRTDRTIAFSSRTWSYHLIDLIRWLKQNPEKMYVDVGREFWIDPVEVKEYLQKEFEITFETEEKFTVDQFKNYLLNSDDFGDAVYFLSPEKIKEYNNDKY